MKTWSKRILGSLTAVATVLIAPTAFAGPGGGGPTGDSCGLFRGASRSFFLINENTTGATIAVAENFGPSGDALDPIPRDFDNNGTDTFGVYSHVRGLFLLRNTNTPGPADVKVRFGARDRQSPANPLIGLSGNWNGTGGDGIGLYDPDASVFILQNTPADGGIVDAVFELGNGGAGLIPIVGDFNGNGTDTVGVYSRTSGTFTFKDANTGVAGVTSIRFGGIGTTNIPFVGDFDDDDVDEVGFYIPAARAFVAATENVDGGGTPAIFKFGGSDSSLVPICGNWDGN